MSDIEGANEKSFPCDRCDAVYHTPQGIGIHRRSAHGIVGVSHKSKASKPRRRCPECGENYDEKYLNYAHLPKAHGIRVTPGKALVPVAPAPPKSSNGLAFSVADDMIILRDSQGRRWVAELFPN